MMIIKNRILLLSLLVILVLLLQTTGNAQKKVGEFSAEPEKFLKELKSYLADSENPDGKAISKAFDEQWAAAFFSDNEKETIRITASALLKKRARAEHLAAYISTVSTLANHPLDEDSRLKWQDALDFMLAKRNFSIQKIDAFFKTTANLAEGGFIYRSNADNGIAWISHKADFVIDFDDEEVLFRFDKLDLSCISRGDSIHIYSTTGILNPITNTFFGKEGRIYWDQAGLSRDSVFAQLKNYSIELKKNFIEADSVLFTNLNYSQTPLMGRLINKILDSAGERISYPRFINYSERIAIPAIFPGVDYYGGFSMHGNRFLSSGDSGEDSFISFKYKDSLFIRFASSEFVISKTQIISPRSRVVIYLEKDSIYHPGISVRYFPDKQELTVFRTGEGMSRSPFYNSYHGLDMDFEQITWKLDEPKMSFGSILGGEGASAVFESTNYFSSERYLELMGYDQQHPFTGLIKYYNSYKEKEFTATQFANFLRMPITAVRQQLMTLSYLGVIDYQVDKEWVVLRDRLFYYVKAASGVVDFDVIAFVTNPESREKASLSLLNHDLRLFGIPQIQLSDSQNVMIYPRKGEIIMKKNRDFEFDGKVEAGKFEFFGKTFHFNYKDFLIDLNNIDSLRIWVERKNSQGLPELHMVKTVIENVTGDLLIDKPNNKSGRVEFAEYPIFTSKRTSFVYYDKFYIQKGVYRKDDFYFMIDPYSIDSLDVFSTQSLLFDGEFYSANIFPPFRESLKVQTDLSLGFITQTPESGFPTYIDKGRYFQTIYLSNRGLRGSGSLNYVTSVSKCDDFIFYPDSMNAFSQRFEIRKQHGSPQFPQVFADNVYQHWEPYSNQLFIQSGKTPFQMYDYTRMTGALRLRPELLEGQGFMEFDDAEMRSKDFAYKADFFETAQSSFDLKSTDPGVYSFKVEDVRGKVDLAARQGTFELNQDSAFVDLPPVKYKISMDMFTWYMDKEEIDLMVSAYKNLNKNIDISMDAFALADANDEGALFLSVHPNQDSLAFFGLVANYKLKDFVLTGQGVKSIPIADARILPGDGMVVIEKDAKMNTLEKARILADQQNRYHLMYNATVTISSAMKYQAMADYTYRDESNRDQKIHFDLVGVDDSLSTFARGTIAEEANFTLSPYFRYKGKVSLSAPREFLLFDGGAQLMHQCSRIPLNYFAFKSEINPLEIYIPVPEKMKGLDGGEVNAGIFMTKDSTHLYSAFLTKPEGRNDIANLPVNGFLMFDAQSREYVIASREKLQNQNLPGNMIRFKVDRCEIEAEGKIDLGIYAGQVKIDAAGSVYHDLNVDSVEMDLMMVMDYYLPSEVLEIMAKSYASNTEMEAADLSDEVFTKSLSELLDEKTAAELLKNLSLYGSYRKIPDKLEKSLVIPTIRLRWNSSEKTYESLGDFAVGNIGKTEVNRLVRGKLELLKTRASNEFTMYLELGYTGWYYLEYKRNNLFIVSSDDVFNFALKELKPERRRNEVDGEPALTVIPANDRKKRYFLEKYQMEENDNPEEE